MQAKATRSVVRAIALCAGGLLLAAAALAAEPTGEPVKWDQARVTQYAVDLNAAVDEAVQEMRKSPVQNMPAQRTTWYEMTETLRQIEESTTRLESQLQKGAGPDETRGTFERIETLRRDTEEKGRKAMIPAPVMDALVKAGAVHNLMMPYYYGKR
jgi:hypothetical protein